MMYGSPDPELGRRRNNCPTRRSVSHCLIALHNYQWDVSTCIPFESTDGLCKVRRLSKRYDNSALVMFAVWIGRCWRVKGRKGWTCEYRDGVPRRLSLTTISNLTSSFETRIFYNKQRDMLKSGSTFFAANSDWPFHGFTQVEGC